MEEGAMETFNLPPAIVVTRVVHVIPKPAISSAVYVFTSSEISSFKVRYVYGMQHMYRTREAYDLGVPPQSLSCIVFNSLTKISQELQRMFYLVTIDHGFNFIVKFDAPVPINPKSCVYMKQWLDF